MPWKSSSDVRKTVVFTIRSSPLPAAVRIASRLSKICFVCASIVSPAISECPGVNPSCPETNTKPLAVIACEYGAPWNGAGASSVRTAVLPISSPPFPWAACLRERHAERLEDRLEHVLRIVAVDQADVQRKPSALRELVQEARDEVGAETADPRLREIDVRYDERPPGCLEHDVRQRLIGGCDSRTVTPHPVRRERLPERLPERPARGRDLRLGLLGSQLQLEVERAVPRQQPEQMVEHGQAAADVARARAVERNADAGLLLLTHPVGGPHPPTQGAAPRMSSRPRKPGPFRSPCRPDAPSSPHFPTIARSARRSAG